MCVPYVSCGGIGMSTATEAMPKSSVQIAFKDALRKSNINKRASVHSLRHSYVNHLLEDGINLRLIQEYLGHNTPTTTSILAPILWAEGFLGISQRTKQKFTI